MTTKLAAGTAVGGVRGSLHLDAAALTHWLLARPAPTPSVMAFPTGGKEVGRKRSHEADKETGTQLQCCQSTSLTGYPVIQLTSGHGGLKTWVSHCLGECLNHWAFIAKIWEGLPLLSSLPKHGLLWNYNVPIYLGLYMYLDDHIGPHTCLVRVQPYSHACTYSVAVCRLTQSWIA